MYRPLSAEEKDSLLKLIKAEGEFIYKRNTISKSLIRIGALLESTTLDCEEKIVSFNGICEFPHKADEFPQSKAIGVYEGSAKMIGINEFELNNPITLKNR